MTAKTRSNFKTSKDADFADAPAGNITAAELRAQFDHLADSALFPEDTLITTLQTQGATADSAAAAIAGKTLLKHNLAATTDPAVGNDGTQGYAVGSRWVNTVTGKEYRANSVGTGAAVWVLIGDAVSLAAVAFTADYEDLDPASTPSLGTAASYNETYFLTPARSDFHIVDAAGNINAARISQDGNSIPLNRCARWINTGSYDKPTNAGPNDAWDGPLANIENPVITAATAYSPSLSDVNNEKNFWMNASVTQTITLLTNANMSAPIGWRFRVRQLGTGEVRIKGETSAITFNGVSSARYKLTGQYKTMLVTKVGTNAYIVEGDIEALPSLATVTYPSAFGTLSTDGLYTVLTLTSATTSGGDVVVSDVDLTIAKVLQTGSGASGGRGEGAGASAAQLYTATAVTLPIGNNAFTFTAPGAAKTVSGVGNNGGSTVFNGVTTVGGQGGPGNGSAVVTAYHGVGACPDTSTPRTGGTGTSGRNGGNGSANATQSLRGAGGGAGAGGAGGAASAGTGGAAGAGVADSITGTSVTYCNGGAGWGGTSGNPTDPTVTYGSSTAGKQAATSIAGGQGVIILRILTSDLASISGV